ALRAEERIRRARAPSPGEVALIAAGPGPRLWERRPGVDDVLLVRLGLADAPSRLQVSVGGALRGAGTVLAVPHQVDLAGAPLVLDGPRGPCRAVARWLLAQLAVLVAPADLEIAVITDRPDEWRWLRWLPHWSGRLAADAEQERELCDGLCAQRHGAGSPARSRRRVVLLVDGCAAPGAVAPLFDGAPGSGPAGIWLGGAVSLPGGAPAVATVDGSGTRLRLADGTLVVADQVGRAWADALARDLAPLVADRGGAAALLPVRVRLRELVTAQPGWSDPGGGLPFTLGVAAAGPIVLDLVRDGPHALVAGTTGAGKSELLRTMITSLAWRHPPDRVSFVLVDYKGGSAFADCAHLPHVAGCVTDLDPHLTARALRSLERELRRREGLLAAAGARDLRTYADARAEGRDPPVPRLVLVVDEFAALAEELPDFVTGLVAIAQRGRSLGIHLVLATQRPGGVVSPEIRANTGLRIALRVTDAADSRDVVDTDGAALLERHAPGRAIVRIAGGEAAEVQVATVSLPGVADGAAVRVVDLDSWRRPLHADPPSGAQTELTEIVATLSAAAIAQRRPPAAPPWLPPLPEVVPDDAVPDDAVPDDAVPDDAVPDDGAPDAAAVGPETSGGEAQGDTAGGVAIGLADLPDEQCRRTYRLDVAGGCSLVIAGGPRSGRTGALLTLALRAARRFGPDDLQISAIDPGGGLLPLAGLPHTGSVVTDPAGAAALVGRLASRVSRAGTRHLLLVDGWERVLAASEQADDGATADALLALLRCAPSVGASVAVAGDRSVLQPRVAGGAGTRLLLRLPDPADYAMAGLPAKALPRHLPPGRAVSCPDGTEIQLLLPPPDPRAAVTAVAARWPGPAPERIV
ncbi:MAG: cell division protein FtsK, partial [Jatrophihabitans sp.]